MIQIVVKPVGASLTRDTQVIGKMDPYCVVMLGAEKHQTVHKNGAGKEPKWQQTFNFFNTAGTNILHIQVWDKDVLKDDLVGEGQFDLTYALNTLNTPINESVSLFHKGKAAGKVYLSIHTSAQGGQGGGCCPGPQGHHHGNKPQW